MKITRLYTGKDGESHFEDVDVPLADAGKIGRLSECVAAQGIIFRENGPNYDYRSHRATTGAFEAQSDSAY